MELDNRQKLTPCKEIDVAEFGDDKFKHTCPRCGFKFNGDKNVSLEMGTERPAFDERAKGI